MILNGRERFDKDQTGLFFAELSNARNRQAVGVPDRIPNSSYLTEYGRNLHSYL